MAFHFDETTMSATALPPIQHVSERINCAIKVFNRAIAAYERDAFNEHHYYALREARHEVASLSELFGEALDEATAGLMVDLTQDMEQLMHDFMRPAFNRRDERTTHRPGEYTESRTLEFQGTLYRKDVPCANPAYAKTKLDEWEGQLVATLASTNAGRHKLTKS